MKEEPHFVTFTKQQPHIHKKCLYKNILVTVKKLDFYLFMAYFHTKPRPLFHKSCLYKNILVTVKKLFISSWHIFTQNHGVVFIKVVCIKIF